MEHISTIGSVHPTVLSLGLVMLSPKLSIIYNRINKEVKWHENIIQTHSKINRLTLKQKKKQINP